MPPKKRDKEAEVVGAVATVAVQKQQPQPPTRMDQMQADHELFLQAFEKPTQIYRFLRTRNQISPIFLYRNLTYMRQRMSRTHKSRRGFRINSILEKIMAKNEQEQNAVLRGYMTLTFLGFYDKKLEEPQDPVKVETLLLKICHKKRKDVSSPIMQVSVGTSEVPINPSENQPPPKAPTVSIPNESFSLNNGHVAKTYMLLLRVYCMSNNSCLIQNCDVEEPAQKRRKSTNGTAIKSNSDEVKLYGSELVVYDKHNRCLLTDGDYELGLQEVQTSVRASPKKHSSWETIPSVKDCGPFDVFGRGPTLKFRLNWTTEPSSGYVDRPPPINPLPSADNKENRPGNTGLDRCTTNHNNNSTNNNNNTALSTSSPLAPSKMSVANLDKIEVSKGNQQIVYQFLYNNNSRQQTEACEDLHCPWCSLDCGRLYSLLKHLKLCHSRFTFTYVPISQGARIDVAINDCYDGSYAGSPHELISQPSNVSYSRTGPTRRTSVTNIVVCRPKRPKPSLSEFLELDENEFENSRPYITGHNRLYHHTVTCLPIYPKELDADSEGENDPKWLQTKTMMMIDDFTDVNEGEKELMKMWNLHVMKHGYVGDCQIPLACQMFLEKKGKELLMKNLYRNFILHMCSLFDFGLVSPVILYQTIQKLQDLMKEEGEDGDIRKVLQKSHAAQVERWLINGGQNSTDFVKFANSNQASKVNFNHHELTNSNARRKTTLPMGSPPGTNHSGIKHPSMMGASKNSVNAKDNQANGELLPSRRKSTNSVVAEEKSSNGNVTSSAPLRRKSIITNSDNTNSAEYHRRKLALDAAPANVNSNQKATQNGTLF
ncbi:PREDICTED: polycomb protein suz12-A [Ceratosolen solmsi marchali]|uniref:Polycomb protein suz12-A n=1 Tax=Ceratosolen solmsi marchali TaxID=326594 RepID=A0AAJ6YJ23_9HYME|nr:PREDICTED: polycomb protein suz12-A [Ceratosolen solmsi marchali]